MAMSETYLAELLQDINFSTDAEAIQGWADLYTEYVMDAEANGVPIALPGLEAGNAAMITALTTDPSISSPGAALVSIPAAIIAFWAAVAAAGATAFPGATLVTPPLNETLAVDFADTCVENVTITDAAEAAANLAFIIHHGATDSGTVTFGMTPYPIT